MYHEELIATDGKVRRVIRSSRTVGQLVSARQYVRLYVKQLPEMARVVLQPKLELLLHQQFNLIKKDRRYGGSANGTIPFQRKTTNS